MLAVAMLPHDELYLKTSIKLFMYLEKKFRSLKVMRNSVILFAVRLLN